MKKLVILVLPVVAALNACTTHEHYHVDRRPVYRSSTVKRSTPSRVKASPSVSSEAPESFRAVERPASYSD